MEGVGAWSNRSSRNISKIDVYLVGWLILAVDLRVDTYLSWIFFGQHYHANEGVSHYSIKFLKKEENNIIFILFPYLVQIVKKIQLHRQYKCTSFTLLIKWLKSKCSDDYVRDVCRYVFAVWSLKSIATVLIKMFYKASYSNISIIEWYAHLLKFRNISILPP